MAVGCDERVAALLDRGHISQRADGANSLISVLSGEVSKSVSTCCTVSHAAAKKRNWSGLPFNVSLPCVAKTTSLMLAPCSARPGPSACLIEDEMHGVGRAAVRDCDRADAGLRCVDPDVGGAADEHGCRTNRRTSMNG